MEKVEEYLEVLQSGKVGFYLMVAGAVILIIATISWLVSLFMEVTKKRASKLSVKYGRADKEENTLRIGKHVVFGILLAIVWVFFIMVL